MRFAGCYLGLLGTLCVAPLHAAEARGKSTTFTLAYEAPLECPSRVEFVSALHARAPESREMEPGAPSDVAIGIVLEGGHLASGTLALRLPDAQESIRHVPSAPCADVVTSMAVIAAMVLEGGELDVPSVGMDGELRARSPVGPSSAPAPVREPPPAARRRPPPNDTRLTREPRRATRRLRLVPRVVFSGSAETGVSPKLGWGVGAGADLELERATVFAPSLRLTARWVPTRSQHFEGYGDAHFRLIAGTLSVCPLRFFSARLGLRPCLSVDAGQLEARGTNTQNERTQRMLWLGLGPSLRGHARLTRALRLEVEGRGHVLGQRDEFLFAPQRTAHTVPDFAFSLAVNALVQFF